MELQTRVLTEKDWDTLVSWWDQWPEWVSPTKEFLPNNGTGGFMIEKEGKPIVAGFVYFTNSRTSLMEFVISDPKYRNEDRQEALEMLINKAEEFSKKSGYHYMYSMSGNKKLLETHKKLGWFVDEKPSYELTKIIK